MPSEDLLPIREIARLTGVNPVTLRAWERRYGLLTPQRTPKGHRLYPPEQLERVRAILAWLDRGASVGQVRALLEQQSASLALPEGEWQARCQQLIGAIGQLAHRALDQQLNQAMALYPASTLCEHLLLPVLAHLAGRWQSPFEAELEAVFFHSWLRSKLGARVYHDNQSLEGPAVLLANDNDADFDAHFWLCAWLLSSSGQAVEILERPVTGRQLQQAVAQLKPRALALHLGRSLDPQGLQRTLQALEVPVLLGGAMLDLHRQGLEALDLAKVRLFDSPQAMLRLLQQPRQEQAQAPLAEDDASCS
ncbi:MerR family transcriptional regulator [Pseudomonas fulva]|nr:MerR family transcriptional regulator [Pseudomonas fulva]MBF8779462.1 MerR family transcriptional regulator [Pseudomonas fulva]